VEASLIRAAHLHQGILKRAVEGRLVPLDPTDEPAEKLLERIRQERHAASAEYNSVKSARKAKRPRKAPDALLRFSDGESGRRGEG
jgi:type I restriction enzyme S subunit